MVKNDSNKGLALYSSAVESLSFYNFYAYLAALILNQKFSLRTRSDLFFLNGCSVINLFAVVLLRICPP